MELKIDKTTKILLGAIALGLFLNASNVFIDKAHANEYDLGEYDWRHKKDNASECVTRLYLTQQLASFAVTLGTKISDHSNEVLYKIAKAKESIETTVMIHAPK